jgi:putative transcriptional regulator
MATKKRKTERVGSKIVRRLKTFVEAIESGEDITKRFTCRTIRLELEPHPYTPAQVKKTRQLLGASQTVFARFIGVSPSAVQDWEQGAKPPKGSACRLMDEIRFNPDYWIRRLQDLATPLEA